MTSLQREIMAARRKAAQTGSVQFVYRKPGHSDYTHSSNPPRFTTNTIYTVGRSGLLDTQFCPRVADIVAGGVQRAVNGGGR